MHSLKKRILMLSMIWIRKFRLFFKLLYHMKHAQTWLCILANMMNLLNSRTYNIIQIYLFFLFVFIYSHTSTIKLNIWHYRYIFWIQLQNEKSSNNWILNANIHHLNSSIAWEMISFIDEYIVHMHIVFYITFIYYFFMLTDITIWWFYHIDTR